MFRPLLLLALAALALASPSFLPSHYPNLHSGFDNHIYDYQPNVGQYGCKHWCRSSYTRQYYCCTTPQQAFLNNQKQFGNRPFSIQAGPGYNPYNPAGSVYNPYHG